MKSPVAAAVLDYLKEQYQAEPEFLWSKFPNDAVFRHKSNRKWFTALMLEIPFQTLGLNREGSTDILDVKCPPNLIGSLLDGARYLPGYHMNKEHWLTLLLDGSIPPEEIYPLIDLSYQLTLSASQKKASRKAKPSEKH